MNRTAEPERPAPILAPALDKGKVISEKWLAGMVLTNMKRKGDGCGLSVVSD